MIAVGSNAKRVSEDLAEYIKEVPDSERQAVKMTARGVTRSLLKMTPPFASLSPTETFGTQKRIGEFAVQRDLGRSFRALEDLKVFTSPKNKRVRENFQAALDKHDPQGMASLLTELKYPGVTSAMIVEDATSDLHDSLRRDGRVPKSTKGYFVFNADSLEQLDQALRHAVGRGKAGWMPAADALGIDVPSWISRHSASGTARDNSETVHDPSFGATNTVPYIANFAGEVRLVDMAFAREAGNLERALMAKRQGLWGKHR